MPAPALSYFAPRKTRAHPHARRSRTLNRRAAVQQGPAARQTTRIPHRGCRVAPPQRTSHSNLCAGCCGGGRGRRGDLDVFEADSESELQDPGDDNQGPVDLP